MRWPAARGSELAIPSTRIEQFVLVVLIGVGLAARFYHASYDFDGDEIFSVELASRRFTEVITRSLADRPHPPLHNILLHFWIQVFGASEMAVRSMGVLCSGLFLLVAHQLLRRFVASWMALGLLGILALSPLFVYYGQQVRPYTLVALFAAANLLAFCKAMDEPANWRRLGAWALTCALLVYTQYLGVLQIGLEVGLAIVCWRGQALRLAMLALAGCLTLAPWFVVAMGPAVAAGSDPLTHIGWISKPPALALAWMFMSIFGSPPDLQTRWLLLLLCALGVAYLISLARRRCIPAEHALLLLVGIALPVAVFLLSVWGPKPIFASRQLLGPALAFVAVVGLAIAALPTAFGAAMMAALLVWTAASLPEAFPENTKPPWRAITARLAASRGSMPVVASEGWARDPVDHYARAGLVTMLDDLTGKQRSGAFLFVCRVAKCEAMETPEFAPRQRILTDWVWGREGIRAKSDKVVLYEVMPHLDRGTN